MVFSLALSVLGVLMGAANLQHPKFGVLLNGKLFTRPKTRPKQSGDQRQAVAVY